jgi:hypothetical protein
MFRSPPENITEAGIAPRTGTLLLFGSILAVLTRRHCHPLGDQQDPPRPAQTQAPQRESDFVDGSGPIFSTYLEMAMDEDKKMAEGWKADADGILIFVHLYPLTPCLIPT